MLTLTNIYGDEMEQVIRERRRGNVVRLLVEVDINQAVALDKNCERLGMTKADAIAHALNIWFGMVEPKEKPNTD